MRPSPVYADAADVIEHVLLPFECTMDDAGMDTAETAWREAFEKGFQEGKRRTEETLTRSAEALAEAVRQARAVRLAGDETLKRDLLRLSLAVARQVMMHELRSDPAVIADIVTHLLEEADGRKVYAVRLHPEDARHLAETPVAALLKEADIAVQPAEEIRPGGCVLETNFGRLDARLETRLEEMSRALLGGDPAVKAPGVAEPLLIKEPA